MTDAAARAAALDPSQSFIVQAPAGSGKTELLIQRFLALLATVEQPEEVVAITFTRKAAAEMRRRVQRALRTALTAVTNVQPHERVTLELARSVVARDAALDWGLLSQPQRLRIDTLDAFNAWLARRLPLLADGVAAAAIVDKADDLYRDAARRTVAALTHDDVLARSVRTLLKSVGNEVEQLERLLAALLPRRDQWLRILLVGTAAELRATLEICLQRLVDDEVRAVAALCEPELLPELAPLLRHAAGAASDALRPQLAVWLTIERPPDGGPIALAAWRGVAALLLTKKGEWRKRISKTEGFGPAHAALGARCRAVLAGLDESEALREALERVSSLPDGHYTAEQWQSLAALRVVLVHLAAELKVTFAERRAVDFVELALAAQRALGQVDAPSDLLLALDRRIRHLLVDEFQDTSQSQRRLLELLTSGWQSDDGRTLFLVGDPMQSIYRFRDADMSLFLLAKQRGIGHVQLRSLTLTQNFRCAPAVVDWVNGAFAAVFPRNDDFATGRAGFRASETGRAIAADQFVRTHAVDGGEFAEAERVAELLVAERRRSPDQSIAVLVQSRTHLAGVRERLRVRGLPVHAVEIDALADEQTAQDLAGLTRALLHRDDRIAWLAVLHAPWCGLRWADLVTLCENEPRAAIWDLLPARMALLSTDGQRRAAALVRTLGTAFARRGEVPLARWVEETWFALDGAACLRSEAARLAAEQFFALLGAAATHGDLDDPARLHSALTAVQPQADPPREQGIEVMTMHRAKGLEFDTVVLLGLAREPRPDEAKALQWMARVNSDGDDDLIMVPAAVTDDAAAAKLTEFVRRAERDRDLAERARLLYVATTRARERLHLVWQLPEGKDRPPASSLLAHLWPLLAAETQAVAESPPATPVAEITSALRRFREPAAVVLAEAQVAVSAANAARPEFAWAGEAAVHVGTVVHGRLQRFAERGIEGWTAQRVAAERPNFARELELLGVERRDLETATTRIVTALVGALADPEGRWLLGPRDEARSELKLTLRAGDTLEHVRLDRTFVAAGERWIVDFKTSRHEGGDVEAFLDSEVARYAPQLERYARAIRAIDARPVRLALYFPLLARLKSWATTS